MKVYEVTAAGFYGGTDETDDRVYWVNAPDEATVLSAIADTGSDFCGEIDIEPGDPGIDFELPRQSIAFSSALRAWDLKADPSTR